MTTQKHRLTLRTIAVFADGLFEHDGDQYKPLEFQLRSICCDLLDAKQTAADVELSATDLQAIADGLRLFIDSKNFTIWQERDHGTNPATESGRLRMNILRKEVSEAVAALRTIDRITGPQLVS